MVKCSSLNCSVWNFQFWKIIGFILGGVSLAWNIWFVCEFFTDEPLESNAAYVYVSLAYVFYMARLILGISADFVEIFMKILVVLSLVFSICWLIGVALHKRVLMFMTIIWWLITTIIFGTSLLAFVTTLAAALNKGEFGFEYVFTNTKCILYFLSLVYTVWFYALALLCLKSMRLYLTYK